MMFPAHNCSINSPKNYLEQENWKKLKFKKKKERERIIYFIHTENQNSFIFFSVPRREKLVQ